MDEGKFDSQIRKSDFINKTPNDKIVIEIDKIAKKHNPLSQVELTLDMPSGRIQDGFVKIADPESFFTEALQSESQFKSSLERLREMMFAGSNSLDEIENNVKTYTRVGSFVAKNTSRIIEGLELYPEPEYLNYALILISNSLREEDYNDRIGFLLDHFQESLGFNQAEREKGERRDQNLRNINLTGLGIAILLNKDEAQIKRFRDELILGFQNSALTQEVVDIAGHMRTFDNSNNGDTMQTFVDDQIIKPLINNYGLDAETLLSFWTKDYTGNFVGVEYLTSNLESLISLERARPGISKNLVEEFGIAHFARYPKDLLIDSYDRKDDKDCPFGLIITPESDHNGSFYDLERSLKDFTEQIKAYGYAARIYEVGSKFDLARAFLDSKKRSARKISFVLLGGHGTSNSIQLGDIDKKLNTGTKIDPKNAKNIIEQQDFSGKGVGRIGDLLADNCEVVLMSCSTGTENGIARRISETYPGTRVIAPNKPTNLTNLVVTKDAGGNLKFKVSYTSTKANETFSTLGGSK